MATASTMRATATVLILVITGAAPFGCGASERKAAADRKPSAASAANPASWHFDDFAADTIPSGWMVEATRRKGPLATWRILKDTTAPSGDQVLALTRPNHTFGGTFNLCWTNAVSFLDGEIQVRFKAVQGEVDRGGGVIWRVQDKDNYYIARFNPLENNFRLYSVSGGIRRTLADARAALPAGEWHTLKVVQRGNRFAGYLDGQLLLEGTDDVFPKSGGVGLWTKADAVTSFDDFSVTSAD